MVGIGAAAQVGSSPVLERSEAVLTEFEALYEAQADFVWRNARRLGVWPAALDDVVQDVFLVAYRRFSELEQPESTRAWMFGILIRVVRDYRRKLRRKDPHKRSTAPIVDPDELADTRAGNPQKAVEQADVVRLLQLMLIELDDAKREVFVLAELEEMTEREISEVLGENANTVHSRLRAARRDFDRAVHRYRKKIERRLP
jgi:RNA polymerase sigma-70 factor (ECF subfamily)